ncbi:MAG: MBOAT family protein [Lachnospiraceae bacterium]|nr:MBOAT family protein [Lachnospiraceae bacterium]
MNITSFQFLCFFTVLLALYYIIPKKMQWGLLLIASIGFFQAAGEWWLIIYPVTTIMIIYFGALYLHRVKEQKKKQIVLSLVVVLCVFLLCILKYFHLGLLAPLGISFYTLTLLGYLFDVYYEIGEPETNIGRLALFGYYFPTMISGPIVQYKEVKDQLYAGHAFDYTRVTFGLQRMIWGFFKKLVISERMGLVVNTVFNQYQDHSGLTVVIGAVCFTFQLYTDFGGCMDIVIGASEALGIILPENFDTPFFATNISEYWRRWHITLGTWLKNYLFYPLLRTKFFSTLPKKLKPKFGKKTAKKLTTYLAMLILWFTIGFWHGGLWKYIIGSGLLHWFYIVSGEVLEPLWKRLKTWFHVTDGSRGFVCFQRVRTFLLVTIGLIFFRADNVPAACHMLGSIFKEWNPEILWNGYLFELGLDWIEFTIAVVSLCILLLVSVLQQKKGIRERIAEKPLPVRWIIFFAAIFYVILLGNYGPDFSAAEFIYQGF